MEAVQPFHVYVDLAPLFLCASHPASGVTSTRSTWSCIGWRPSWVAKTCNTAVYIDMQTNIYSYHETCDWDVILNQDNCQPSHWLPEWFPMHTVQWGKESVKSWRRKRAWMKMISRRPRTSSIRTSCPRSLSYPKVLQETMAHTCLHIDATIVLYLVAFVFDL